MVKHSLTQRMYYKDSSLLEFSAAVVDRLERDGRPAVVLDRTCFYPESGGQPADSGEINGIPVVDVIEEEDRILHVLSGKLSAVEVNGRVDWEKRFDHMQQHTGQHILSQCFYEILDAETLSFHMGRDYSTLEINLRKISSLDLDRIENRANEIVYENRPVKIHWGEAEELKGLPLRRPPQKKGKLRIIEVKEFDFAACGGTHCRSTGEVGIIKISRWERIRDNLRFEFLCGKRAFADYAEKHRNLRNLSNSLTVGEREVPAAVEKLRDELKGQKRENRRLHDLLLKREAQEFLSDAEGPILKKVFFDKGPEDIRFLATTIIKNPGIAVIFGLKAEERAYLVLARSSDVDLDLREIAPLVSGLIEGKGGGPASLIQMAGGRIEGLEEAVEKAAALIIKSI